jgi:hypothetical protein
MKARDRWVDGWMDGWMGEKEIDCVSENDKDNNDDIRLML